MSSLAVIGAAVLLAVGLFSRPAHSRLGGFGGGYGRAGGGFRMGGDGFAGGNPSYTAWSHPNSYYPNSSNFQGFHNTNQTARFNEANSMNQSRYNEEQSMQNEHYQNESALSHQQYNQASNLESNSNYDPYGGCCGSSGGSAAAGMMGGMAMGATMESAVQPRQSTTIVENAAPAPQYAAPLSYLPPGATPTQMNGSQYFYSNGTYYKPEFNGSQVVYVPSPG